MSSENRFVLTANCKTKTIGKFTNRFVFIVNGDVVEYLAGSPSIYVARHYTAFKVNKDGPWWCAKKDVLKQMVDAGKQLVTSARSSVNRRDIYAAKWWFGDNVDINTLTNKLETFQNFVNNLSLLCFECADGEDYRDSFAACAQDRFGVNSTELRIYLGGGFKNPKYTLGENINAYLHELSHICLRTKDVKIRSTEFYTAKKARALALFSTEEAINNAENWGYYLCEHRRYVTNSDSIDWTGSYERVLSQPFI